MDTMTRTVRGSGWVLRLAGVTLLAFGAAACGEITDGGNVDPDPSPLVYSVGMADGFHYQIRGDRSGHAPGEASRFEVAMTNPGSDEASIEYCFVLVEETGQVTKIGGGEFTVEVGADLTDAIDVTFPEQAEEGRYGMGIVVPGDSSVVNTLWIGAQQDDEAFDYDVASGLPSHPACE